VINPTPEDLRQWWLASQMSPGTSARTEIQALKDNTEKVLSQIGQQDKVQSVRAKRTLFVKFAELWNNAEGLAAFEKALKKAVVQLLDVGLIKEDHIQVEISETSGHSRRLSSSSAKGLKVTYMIRVPNGVEASGVVMKINSKSTDELRTSVDSALIESAKTAPDIKGLTSSAVTIAAQGSLNTKSAASELSLSLSGRATAHAVLVLAISLLGATTFSMTNK